MALVPFKTKWSHQLTTGASASFVMETTALRNTNAVYNPIFRFHNVGTEDVELQIVYTLNLGVDTDDPLNSGVYNNTVVDATIPSGAMYTYDFDGIQLDKNTAIAITHEVTITNVGVASQIFHSILTGSTEVQTQFSAGTSF